MLDDEKIALLNRYEEWKQAPPVGWRSIADLNLRVPIQVLYDDGSTERHRAASNAAFLIDPRKPLAWREAG